MARNKDVLCLCIWCNHPFDPDNEEYYNGHKICGDKYEQELNRRDIQKLIAVCPPGTRFDLAGGATCD